MKGNEVPEHSGEHQDFRECVECAESQGRALTLVSFTKGVSPPQRPALYTWSLKTLMFTEERCIRNSTVLHLCFHFQRDTVSKTRNSCDRMHTSLSDFFLNFLNTHWVVKSVWMRHLANSVSADPQLPALWCSLMHMDVNCSMRPPIRQ